jgi:opacity protein-like surface antigen
MQASYVNFGNIKSSIQNIQVLGTPAGDLTAAVKLQGITLAAVPKASLTNNLDLFGKLGIAYFSGKSSVRNPIIGTIEETDTGSSAIAGLGIAVNVEKFSFTVEYERYQRVMEDTNFNFFSVGLRSNF